jgi:hypothetical protein
MMQGEEKKSWWKTIESLGAAALGLLAFAPEIIDALVQTDLLKDYTLVAKLALPLSVLVKALGLKKQYLLNNLPSGLTKFMDQVPDKYTGVKGSNLPGGLSK